MSARSQQLGIVGDRDVVLLGVESKTELIRRASELGLQQRVPYFYGGIADTRSVRSSTEPEGGSDERTNADVVDLA